MTISADGLKVAAVVGKGSGSGGPVYVSMDGGNTWITPLSQTNWVGIASSIDGMKLVAIDSGGLVYVSNNSGIHWSSKLVNNNWSSVSCSADGNQILVTTSNSSGAPNYVYCSLDGGVTWVTKFVSGSRYASAISGDGTRAYVWTASGLEVSAPRIPSLSYTPAANGYGLNYDNFTFQVEDDGFVANLDPVPRAFSFNVENTHDDPKFVTAIPDQIAVQNVFFSWQIPAATFIPTDPEALITYRVRMGGNLPLPPWLSFDSATATFTGTPGHADIRTLSLTVTQTQSNGYWATSNVFNLAVPSFLPSGIDGSISTTEGTPYTFSAADFGFTDADTPPDGFKRIKISTLPSSGRFTNGGAPLEVGDYCTLTAAAPLVFTPAANESGSPFTSFTFQIEDTGLNGWNLDTTPNTMVINVTPVTNPPWLVVPIYTQSAPRNLLFTLPIPPTTFEHENPAAVLSYTADLTSGALLPSWLTFNTTTLTFSGTPPTNSASYLDVRLRATEAGSPPLSSTTTFRINSSGGVPVGIDGAITMDEDTNYFFTPADFQFSDPSDSPPNRLKRIKITTLPLVGDLYLGGNRIGVGSLISLSGLNPGSWKVNGSTNTGGHTACSGDGGTNVIAVPAGKIYISRNGGQTWFAKALDASWRGVAISADGHKIAAVAAGSFIYTSIDYGESWTARSTAKNWSSVACSTDGTKLVAAVRSGQLYTSTDSGVNWIPRETTRNWDHVCSSFDGVRLAAVVYGGLVYTSSDSGVTWTGQASTRNWESIASSADGRKLVASVGGGSIYTSTNAGGTWTARGTVQNWSQVVSSADGNKLRAIIPGTSGSHYYSEDAGVNWVLTSTNYPWFSVATSAEDSNLVASTSTGAILNSDAVQSELNYRPIYNGAGQSYASFTFQVEDDGLAGVNLDQSPNTMTIHVRNVNDAPSPNYSYPLTAVENQVFLHTLYDNEFYDRDVGTILSYSASSEDGSALPAWLNFNPTNKTFSGTPRTFDRSLKVRLTATDNGTPPLSGTRMIDLSVTAVPDAPSGASRSITINQNEPYALTPSDFGFTDPSDDPPNYFRAVKISTLPSAGTLLLNGAPALAGDFAMLSQTLTFVPASDALGAAYSSFDFQVHDGGTSSNLDLTPNTITFNVIQSPFQIWAAQNGLPTDPNANAGANLLRYAFGLNADGSGGGEILLGAEGIIQRGDPVVGRPSTPNGTDFTAVFGRRKNAGLSYAVQFSADLATWENSTATPTVLVDDGLIEACGVPYPAALGDGRTPRFFRISVTH